MRSRDIRNGRPSALAVLASVLALLALLLAACARGPAAAPPRTPRRTPSRTTSATPTPPPPSAGRRALTPAQLAGQRVIFGYKGLTPPATLLARVRRGEAAGVIFFGDNISSPRQLRVVIRQLQRASASPTNPVRAPLLMMTDQEGGQLRRLRDQPPVLSEREIGGAADPAAAATAAGADAGRALRAVGINVNLAPVLDVYRTPGDFDDQFGRSYSTDPRIVARLGANFIRAQQREGVAASAKHFPGLGSAETTQNTDERVVTLRVSRETLTTIDEPPFESAIAARVRLVMVSWAIYPALDPRLPAGLSTAVVQRELRERLGFKGVVVSDGILADALQPFGTVGDRARLSAEAGLDLLLCGKAAHTTGVGAAAAAALEAGYRDGTLDGRAFRASVERVIALRRSLEP